MKGLWDGFGQAGPSCPVTTSTRINTDKTVTAALGHHGWPPDKGHSRQSASRLAFENGIVDPRDPAQNPPGPTGLHVARPTGYQGGRVEKPGD